MHPVVKVRESVRRCTMPAVKPRKVRYPQKTHGFCIKRFFRRLSEELKYKTKIFCFVNEGFSYMTCACVRELVRARDISMTCDHSCRNAYVVAQCVCND